MPKGKSASNQQFKGLCVCKPPFLEGTGNPNQNSWSLSKQPGLRRNLLGGVFCRSISLAKILDVMDGYLCRSLQKILVKTYIYIYVYTVYIYIYLQQIHMQYIRLKIAIPYSWFMFYSIVLSIYLIFIALVLSLSMLICLFNHLFSIIWIHGRIFPSLLHMPSLHSSLWLQCVTRLE